MMSGPIGRARPVLAYLTGEYPRATDTFIQREVAALRRLGYTVRTFSVRQTDAAHHVGPEQKQEARNTQAILPRARNPLALLRAHLGALARGPGRYLSAFALAMRTPQPGFRGLLYQLFYFAEAGVLAAELRRAGATHLHNHFGNSSCSVAMLASAISGTPYSYTLHGPSELFEPMSWRIDQKIARARFVACISHFARSQGMLFSDPAHWDRMRVVHCGVEPARYLGVDHAGDATRPRLLFVGRLSAIKGLLVLFEALARLRAQGRDCVLTLVGDGPDRQALEAAAHARGLGAAAIFTGYLSQDAVARHLAETDVFVLPSFAEGVPVVLMEAMANRTPIVATRVAGVPELVEDGVHGLLVAPGDPDALADALDRLIADPALRRSMGMAGRQKIEAEFDVDREAAWLAALFDGAADGALPPGLRPAVPAPVRTE